MSWNRFREDTEEAVALADGSKATVVGPLGWKRHGATEWRGVADYLRDHPLLLDGEIRERAKDGSR